MESYIDAAPMYGLALWQLRYIINYQTSFGVVSYIDVLLMYDPGDGQLRWNGDY